ncbi:structural protein [Acinetobacter radioresistens]|uniref:hypothetical protein n=1 Tax=Acinetobacter radioresistens TaxID=40216 RepID=UPI000DAC9749|nr:hypothetical protein [Acinetobacter radioresistens]AWV86206.1 hypothetical protein DOM24_06290 [Acinetobacter radioresistens]MCX0327654.1 hypothetical protein [Acinetobacter radioresistens]
MKRVLTAASRAAYKEWFNSFSSDEQRELVNMGVACGADSKFFKHEILDLLSHLDNERLRDNKLLFKKFTERFIALVPDNIRSHVNWTLLENSRDYRSWFANRQMFVFNYLGIKDICEHTQDKNSGYLLWAPIIDDHTPASCQSFSNKIFNIFDKEFQEHAVEHWSRPQEGCRCSLISITHTQAKQYLMDMSMSA